MARKKGYQLFDVPNNKRGERFVQDINDFINRDWYGYQRRGRSPKPGVKTNSQRQARVLDSSSWTIYIRGLPTPRKFIEHSKLQRARTSYKYYRELYDKASISNEELQGKVDRWKKEYDKLNEWTYKETCNKDMMLDKYKISLFGWNISLWKEERREGNI